MKNLLLKGMLMLSLPLLIVSCDSNDDDNNPEPAVVKEWNIDLSTANENPAVPGRTETGNLSLQLMADNSLKYTITVNNVASGDALQAAHIHTGDPVINGPVIQDFSPSFNGGTATGTITNVRQSLVDSLKNDANQLYFNVHSTQVGGGLVRGQLNSRMEFAQDVVLSGENEVPQVVTTATGNARLRMTADKNLYYIVNVDGLESGDEWTAAHIHNGAAGANGSVLVGLAVGPADFGVPKVVTLDDAGFAAIKTAAIYVNAHTNLWPDGAIRGQIR